MTHRFHIYLGICIAAIVSFTGCSKEPRPPSVNEFMQNELLLQSTLVRCTENRSEMRYEPECVNVREAVNLLAVREEKASREKLEAQSKRKREALRRTQQAVAEARRLNAERQRIQEQGGIVVVDEVPIALPQDGGTVALEAAGEAPASSTTGIDDAGSTATTPAVDVESDPAPGADETLANDTTSDIEAVRQELKRRDEDGPG